MNINEVPLSGGCHVVILGAGASIASTLRDPEIHGLPLPSMNNLPDVCGLNDVLTKFPQNLICDNFEETYSNIAEHDPMNPYLEVMNNRIYAYFSKLELPPQPTIYDYLVMSLRDKDVIATFNWDPFLYQAWWRNYHHGSKPQMIYLHGNVAVGYNEENNMLGRAGAFAKDSQTYFKPTQLLYPIKHKDYNKDSFIQKSWQMLQNRLNQNKCNTRNVTIFGYSAPISDVEALHMMKSAWGDIGSRNLEQFEFIDIRPEQDVLSSWSQFVHSHHYDYHNDYFKSSLALYPRRTDEAFFCHFLPTTPAEAFIDSNPVPTNLSTLQELWDWHEALIAKEK